MLARLMLWEREFDEPTVTDSNLLQLLVFQITMVDGPIIPNSIGGFGYKIYPIPHAIEDYVGRFSIKIVKQGLL